MNFETNKWTYWLLGGALCVAMLIPSCQRDKALEEFIPADAGVVVTVHASDIATKLLFEQIGNVDISNILDVIGNLNVYPYSTKDVNSIFEQPSASGIDLFSDFYFYIGNDAQEDAQFAGILFEMRDSKKLTQVLENELADSLEIVFDKNSRYQSALFPSEKMILGWNQKVACLVLSRNERSFPNIADHLAYLFGLNKGASILNDTNFVSLSEEQADISVFLRPENLHATAGFVPTAYLRNDVEYLNAFINFEKGKLLTKVKQYLKNDDISTYHNILDSNQHTDLFRRVNEEEIVAFLNLQYNKGLVPKLIDAYKLQMALKAVLLTLNVNEDELYKLTEGDIMVIFLGEIESMQEVTTYEYDEDFNKSKLVEKKNVKAPGFVAELIVGDKMKGLLHDMKAQGLMKEDSGIYNMGEITGFDTYFTLHHNRLIITTDDRFLQRVKRRLFGMPKSHLQQLGTDYPISGYLDVHQLKDKFPTFGSKYFTGVELLALSQVVNTFAFYTEPLEGRVIDSQLEITFTDKEKSSLSGAANLLEFLKLYFEEKNEEDLQPPEG